MDHLEARKLIRDGVASKDSIWADLGAGAGTFTCALAGLLKPEGTVYAVDKSEQAVRTLRRLGAAEGGATIRPLQGDFTGPLELPALDGILMANALHFTEDQARVLRQIVDYLRPGGRLLLVEYDHTRANRWVPFPVPWARDVRRAGPARR